ncbi:MAG: amidohydrolase [Oceanospirillales bacterium]|nr:amidohydrolase [Oceanospirillales bacterium]MBR9887896.1 amidohydrolase [Oceanospirillales bacterium]
MSYVADKIIINGNIHTMDDINVKAEALAIYGDKIIAVGSNADIQMFAGDNTQIIDAKDQLVLPGFQDTHLHFQATSADFFHYVALHEMKTMDDLLNEIERFSREHPHKKWIKGIGFNPAIFNENTLTKERLDAVTGGRPALIFSFDYHSGWANSEAFRVAGVTAASPEPASGSYARCPDGSPKGYIYEDAIWAMNGASPSFSNEDYSEGMQHYCKVFNQHGITGILDAAAARKAMENYQALNQQGQLTLRVAATSKIFAHLPLDEQMQELLSMRETYADDMVKLHSAKFFLDGVLESGTATLLEPRCDTGSTAALMFDQPQINAFFAAFDKEKFQLHVHTIGDGAVNAALNGIEYARQMNGAWDSRHQLAHIQLVTEDDFPRFKQLGVYGNVQPLWAQPDPDNDRVALEMLGEERCRQIFPIAELVRQGMVCALSSDWGVSTFDPFAIMQTALTRQGSGANENSPAHNPQYRIDIDTAIKGYTINAARAAWREKTTGSLTVGKFADLIILNQDLYSISPYEIENTKVLLTLLGGKEVYRDASC